MGGIDRRLAVLLLGAGLGAGRLRRRGRRFRQARVRRVGTDDHRAHGGEVVPEERRAGLQHPGRRRPDHRSGAGPGPDRGGPRPPGRQRPVRVAAPGAPPGHPRPPGAEPSTSGRYGAVPDTTRSSGSWRAAATAPPWSSSATALRVSGCGQAIGPQRGRAMVSTWM